ncbi:unnamed protein product [Ixodes hexagonus]
MLALFPAFTTMSVPKNVAAVDFNILDDDFWDDPEDESAIEDPKVPDSVSQGVACTVPAESNDEDSVFLATGLNTEDLDSCFDEEFDDCHDKRDVGSKPKQSKDPRQTEIPESFSDGSNSLLFDDGEFEVVPRKRKFPGPAGILPKTNASLSFSEIGRAVDEAKTARKADLSDDLLCTPWNCEDDDPDSPWQLMRQEMGMDAGNQNNLSSYCIAWVLKMKRERQLPRGKVPVLPVCIKSVCNEMITLRDKTGEILASVDKSFQEFKACLKTGTTLLLRKATAFYFLTAQVGVYVNAKKEHCLLLTRDNLVHIYSRPDDVGPARKLEVNPMTCQELEALCTELRLGALEDAARDPSPVPRSPLFATSGGSPATTLSRTLCRNSSPALNPNFRGNVAYSCEGGSPTVSRSWQQQRHAAVSRLATPQRDRSFSKQSAEACLRGALMQSRNARGGQCETNGTTAKSGSGSPGLPLDVRKVPSYKSPLSATTSNTTTAVGVGRVMSARVNAVTPIVPNPGNGASPVGPTLSRTVVNPVRTMLCNQACIHPAVPSKGSRENSEDLQWLEDDADDIFRTIDDGGLF